MSHEVAWARARSEPKFITTDFQHSGVTPHATGIHVGCSQSPHTAGDGMLGPSNSQVSINYYVFLYGMTDK